MFAIPMVWLQFIKELLHIQATDISQLGELMFTDYWTLRSEMWSIVTDFTERQVGVSIEDGEFEAGPGDEVVI